MAMQLLGWKPLRVLKIILLAVIVGLAIYFFSQKDLKEKTILLAEWLQSMGWKGMFLYGTAYFFLGMFSLPASMITISAGYLFGFLPGILIANFGSTLGAVGLFLLGRFLFRSTVERALKGHPHLNSLDELVEAQGLKILILTRLALFMPFGLLNYAFSATRIPLHVFAFGSMAGMLPGTILYVLIGNSLDSLGELLELSARPAILTTSIEPRFGKAYFYLTLVGVFSSIVLSVYLARLSKLAFAKIKSNPRE